MEEQKQLQIKQVDFNGDKLLAVSNNDTGKIYVGVRWVCDGLGLTNNLRRVQQRKILRDTTLSKGMSKMSFPSSGGIQIVTCIELTYLPLWLAKINVNIVKDPHVKEKLVNYQLHAKDVLANAFVKDNAQAHLSKFIIPQTYSTALRLAADLQEKIEILEPKAEKYDDFIDSKGCFNLNQVAKTLHTGRTRLFKKLREIGILNKDNSPKQEYVEQGLFTTKVYIIKCKRFKKTVIQPLTNPRGLDFVSEVMRCHQ